ncbi:MAG: hypothetical protein E7083_04930 [Bacteroidales bacterium]|nr:hypothetical protein [Bacteroidales bacterium]
MKNLFENLCRILSIMTMAMCLVVATSSCSDDNDDNLYNNGGGEIVDSGDDSGSENPSEGEGNEDEGGEGETPQDPSQQLDEWINTGSVTTPVWEYTTTQIIPEELNALIVSWRLSFRVRLGLQIVDENCTEAIYTVRFSDSRAARSYAQLINTVSGYSATLSGSSVVVDCTSAFALLSVAESKTKVENFNLIPNSIIEGKQLY